LETGLALSGAALAGVVGALLARRDKKQVRTRTCVRACGAWAVGGTGEHTAVLLLPGRAAQQGMEGAGACMRGAWRLRGWEVLHAHFPVPTSVHAALGRGWWCDPCTLALRMRVRELHVHTLHANTRAPMHRAWRPHNTQQQQQQQPHPTPHTPHANRCWARMWSTSSAAPRRCSSSRRATAAARRAAPAPAAAARSRAARAARSPVAPPWST